MKILLHAFVQQKCLAHSIHTTTANYVYLLAFVHRTDSFEVSGIKYRGVIQLHAFIVSSDT